MTDEYLGYIKYEGELVHDGLLDGKKAAQALLGFDEALRHFVYLQAPNLKGVEFELPVRIRKGSWEALIPVTIGGWVLAALGIAGTAYLTAAATKMGENDFEEASLKELFRKAVTGMQWLIRLGKHVGNLTTKKFEGAKFRPETQEVGIPNESGELLYVPKEFIDWYSKTNPKLLQRVSEVIEEERQLVVGVEVNGAFIEERVTRRHKHVFTMKEEDQEEVLFPELTHGLAVELEGYITRGNETSNSLGFRYREHILTCYPAEGSMVRYKFALFSKCKMKGLVSRADEHGTLQAKRPKIIFERIIQIGPEKTGVDLFDGT